MPTELHPRNLPDLRIDMINQWRRPDGLFFKMACFANPRMHIAKGFGTLDPGFDARALPEAQLWWVSADMTRLVQHASKSLLPTTLTDDLLQTKTGMAVFEDPLVGNDAADPGQHVKVWIMLWAEHKIAVAPKQRYLSIATYSIRDFNEGGDTNLIPNGSLYPLGRTDWEFLADTDEIVDERTHDMDERMESMAEDRRWLATLHLLAGQKRIAQVSEYPTYKAAVRRSQRARLSADVRFVDLRAPKRKTNDSGEPRPVDWRYRWIVGGDTGGFWRQQAYGPGHSLRRPQWILPFTKGPEGKPLKVKDTVHILRGDQP